jgi:cytosine/uracil/thiamine/allantoin permease
MLKAIWPSIVHMHNRFPEQTGITSIGCDLFICVSTMSDDTPGLVCYAVFWTAQLPFLLLSPQHLRYLFLVKSILVPAAWVAIFIWSLTRVPPSVSLGPNRASLSGSKLSWAWLSAMNTAIAGYCTLSVNIPDFTVSHYTLQAVPS